MPDRSFFKQLRQWASDPSHGWSIGSFGAIGEFVRDPDEPCDIASNSHSFTFRTERGAIRVENNPDLIPFAWDTLSSDGESWGHSLALCCPLTATPPPVIQALGPDSDAIKPEDQSSYLFDLGVGTGQIRMALRSDDPALVAAMQQSEGRSFLNNMDLMREVLRAQPNRVLLSPAGRIEVYQNVPPPDGKSPEGPHTHLLAKLVPLNRPHSANTPIPDTLQAALYFHPQSPWRNLLGERHDYRPAAAEFFQPYLDLFGLESDQEIANAVTKAVIKGVSPQSFIWPDTRRGRTKARITLRRLATQNLKDIDAWRSLYDRFQADADPDFSSEGQTA